MRLTSIAPGVLNLRIRWRPAISLLPRSL